MCIRELVERKFLVEAIGLREGIISGVPIQKGMPAFSEINTVALYLGARNQREFYQYILDLYPLRVIFNPGTENPEFELILQEAGIEVQEACSIMMLHSGVF